MSYRKKIAMLSLFSIGMASFLLFHFILILAYGVVSICENSTTIIAIEVTGLLFIILFCIDCLFKYTGKKEGEK